MVNTIELIKKHTQEYNEYMLKNGKYSFHRFADGSIHFTKPIFVTRNIVKETDILPIRPVREFEELVEATTGDTLVTINEYIRFRGRDAILDETEIAFYNSSIRIEYTGINSIHIDYNHELRKVIVDIQKGYYGDIVFINGVETNIHDFVLLESYLVYSSGDDSYTHGVYAGYDNINVITDAECRCIYRR